MEEEEKEAEEEEETMEEEGEEEEDAVLPPVEDSYDESVVLLVAADVLSFVWGSSITYRTASLVAPPSACLLTPSDVRGSVGLETLPIRAKMRDRDEPVGIDSGPLPLVTVVMDTTTIEEMQ